MLLPNPNRHYPLYRATVVLKDGRVGTVTGEGEGENIYIPGEEEAIYGVEVIGVDQGGQCTPPTLWILGDFTVWDENWKELPALDEKPEEDEPEEDEPEEDEEDEEDDDEEYPDWENEVNE